MPGPHCPPRTACPEIQGLFRQLVLHNTNELNSTDSFSTWQLGWGSGEGGWLPSMLIVVVWLLLIGSNCILSRLYLCIFFIKLLYFVMGLR